MWENKMTYFVKHCYCNRFAAVFSEVKDNGSADLLVETFENQNCKIEVFKHLKRDLQSNALNNKTATALCFGGSSAAKIVIT